MRRRLARVVVVIGLLALLLVIWAVVIAIFNPSRWYMHWAGHKKVARISFHGQVVDGRGNPVGDATVKIVIESYSPFYLFGGPRRTYWEVERSTRSDGTFDVDGARGTDLTVMRVSKSGHEWLYETETSEKIGKPKTNNRNYDYAPQGYTYVPDRNHSAVFPLLKPGERPAVWPSRGGWDQDHDGTRVRNGAIQPKKPSIKLPDPP